MPAKVLVIGLDAAEATLLERWAAEGDLPAFARLTEKGAVARLGNSLETLPGAIWPELTTGISGGRTAQYYHPRQLHTGETALRRIEPEEAAAFPHYWTHASNAGRRVAVVDQPQTVMRDDLNGSMMTEWGLHDRNFGIASDPPALLEEIRTRWGDHPIASCDMHGYTREGYEQLLAGLVTGAGRKAEILLELYGREDWDLFACCFGETHCVGHQFWHFFDPLQPGHDPNAPAELQEAIKTVYLEVGKGVEALLDAAGPETAVLVVASHGMGTSVGGYQLLPEFLVRIGFGSGSGTTAQVRSHTPTSIKGVVRALTPGPVRRRVQARAGSLPLPLDSPDTKAIAVPNNRCGGIRFNLKGREPHGMVEPGAEKDALVEELRRELSELEEPESGERVVKRVVTAEEAFGPDHHSDIPDVMVVFRTDLGQINSAQSPRAGLLKLGQYGPNMPRTGDHTVESRLWAVGPGIAPGARLPEANVLDLAPTVLELLDVPRPDGLDGQPIAGVVARA
jgi:predicted AlkP superfamily phosphohydrolase/phosphomutase